MSFVTRIGSVSVLGEESEDNLDPGGEVRETELEAESSPSAE